MVRIGAAQGCVICTVTCAKPGGIWWQNAVTAGTGATYTGSLENERAAVKASCGDCGTYNLSGKDPKVEAGGDDLASLVLDAHGAGRVRPRLPIRRVIPGKGISSPGIPAGNLR